MQREAAYQEVVVTIVRHCDRLRAVKRLAKRLVWAVTGSNASQEASQTKCKMQDWSAARGKGTDAVTRQRRFGGGDVVQAVQRGSDWRDGGGGRSLVGSSSLVRMNVCIAVAPDQNRPARRTDR